MLAFNKTCFFTVVMFLLLTVAISIMSISNFANAEISKKSETFDDVFFSITSKIGSDTYSDFLMLEDNNSYFSLDQPILLEFTLNSGNSLANFTYSTIGINVLTSYIYNLNRLIISLEFNPDFGDYKIYVDVTSENDDTISDCVYAIANEYGIFNIQI
ncbi:MAG: hypothetical protein LBF12_01480 [Christensenellaceae bacterium]|jgi:hypothetical protein|nr:hypothetical protein [Christensenellaceae bacterium]